MYQKFFVEKTWEISGKKLANFFPRAKWVEEEYIWQAWYDSVDPVRVRRREVRENSNFPISAVSMRSKIVRLDFLVFPRGTLRDFITRNVISWERNYLVLRVSFETSGLLSSHILRLPSLNGTAKLNYSTTIKSFKLVRKVFHFFPPGQKLLFRVFPAIHHIFIYILIDELNF